MQRMLVLLVETACNGSNNLARMKVSQLVMMMRLLLSAWLVA